MGILQRLFLFLGMCANAHAGADLPGPRFARLNEYAWQTLNQAHGVMVGGSARVSVQVIFDANCPLSSQLYRQLRRDHPTRPIRWVPVAYFRRDSAEQAAAILAHHNPPSALHQNFRRYDFDARHGGFVELPEAVDEPAATEELTANNDTLKQQWMSWAVSTPVIVVRTEDRQVLMHGGAADPVAVEKLLMLADEETQG